MPAWIIKMDIRNKLKEIEIKNRAWMINSTDINFSNISLGKKLYKSISVYDILYKTSTGPKPLRIRFDKIDGFIMVFDGTTKHFALFDKNRNKIKYLISKKVVLQKYWLSIMWLYSLSQLLVRTKINTTIIHF